MRQMTARELATDLAFNLMLALIAQVVFRLTQWSGFYVLIIVFIGGHSLRALVQYWRRKRARSNEDLPPELTDASGRRPIS